MTLPNAEQAVVDVRKLRAYCLNVDHPRGQHKARVFKSALGWTADEAEGVQGRLLEAVLQADASVLGADGYGQRYAIDFVAQGVSGPVTRRSLWIIRHGEVFHDSLRVMSSSGEFPS